MLCSDGTNGHNWMGIRGFWCKQCGCIMWMDEKTSMAWKPECSGGHLQDFALFGHDNKHPHDEVKGE